MVMFCKFLGGLICAVALASCAITAPRNVYVGEGQNVEIARPVRVTGWVTNKKTGHRELRTVEAQAGWYVGRISK